jgi:hypothetical protein
MAHLLRILACSLFPVIVFAQTTAPSAVLPAAGVARSGTMQAVIGLPKPPARIIAGRPVRRAVPRGTLLRLPVGEVWKALWRMRSLDGRVLVEGRAESGSGAVVEVFVERWLPAGPVLIEVERGADVMPYREVVLLL